MHLVFLNQYYPPDAAPTGVLLEDLADGLVRKGHAVTVLCSNGGYAGGPRWNAVRNGKDPAAASDGGEGHDDGTLKPRVERVRAFRFGRGNALGKMMDYTSYYAGVAWRLMVLRPRPDRIVALTTPPYLSALARVVSRLRGADHAHWVMDLYPDVMVAHGMVAARSYSNRILEGLTRWGLGGKRCAAVLTLGPDMAARVGRYIKGPGDDAGNVVEWVPLWGVEYGGDRNGEPRGAVCDAALALRRQRKWADKDLVVMYSGNMGLGHRFGEILAAVRELAGFSERDQEGRPRMPGGGGPARMGDERVRFVFFGGGMRREEILEFADGHPGCGVEIDDYAPAEILAAHLRSADVHVVSLDAEWTGTMVPSKLQGIFHAGRPVIFIGSEASSIGTWVRESGGGWVVKPGDVAGLLAALEEARNPRVRAMRGRAAMAFAQRFFDRESNVARAAEILSGTRCHAATRTHNDLLTDPC